ncbi:MAG: hypothetical protein ABW130_20735 [Candidatus Thiodiazotropha lotti]
MEKHLERLAYDFYGQSTNRTSPLPPGEGDQNEIAKNDHNLNIPRYVDTFEKEEINLMAVYKERDEIKKQLADWMRR